MNGNSKREKLDAFIRREVHRAIAQVAWDRRSESNLTLSASARDLETTAAWNISGDPYRMKELTDIVEWKVPKKGR